MILANHAFGLCGRTLKKAVAEYIATAIFIDGAGEGT